MGKAKRWLKLEDVPGIDVEEAMMPRLTDFSEGLRAFAIGVKSDVPKTRLGKLGWEHGRRVWPPDYMSEPEGVIDAARSVPP